MAKSPQIAYCAALLLASCQSGPQLSDSWSTLEVSSQFDVEYIGELRAQPAARMMSVEPPKGLGLGHPSGILDAGMAKPPQQWAVHLELVQMSIQALNKLLPGAFPGGGPVQGGKVKQAEFRQALEAMTLAQDGIQLSSPSVLCNGGEHAWMTMLQQSAFLNGFEYKRGLGSLVVDPEVSVFHSGLAVGLLPDQSAIAGEASLEFDITMTDLLKMNEVKASFPNQAGPLGIQVPVYSQQVLKGSVHLAADEVAYLPYLYTNEGEMMMVFLHVESVGGVQIGL